MNEYQFKDLSIGLSANFSVEITQKMVDSFCEISNDRNPLHTNREYAQSLGHKDVVVHGCLTNSFLSQLAGVHLPGKYCLILSINSNFSAPVFIGDVLSVEGEVSELSESTKTCIVKAKMTNQEGKIVLKSRLLLRLEV